VADTGIGIAPEVQEQIFNPFIQADGSTTRHYGGTGLGLAISRRLVELMGGSIQVKSRPGAGSRFCFTARFDCVHEEMVIPVPEQLNLAGRRVLIVDDITINRDLLGHLIGKWGMKGDAVSGAEQALLQLRRAEEHGIRYDLILLDVHMPEIDGWALATGIRDNPVWDDCRIIMMPSVGEKGDSRRCRELRLDGYLMKPIIPDELEELIQATLGRRPEPEQPSSAPRDYQEPLRILVAEDVEINQKVAQRILEKLGHRVTIAGNGREAVTCWESGGFDLILMDIQMPEMDGYEAAGMIRDREKGTGRHIPIAAMTAFALKGDDEKCLTAGMDGYISKPVKAEEVRLTIERLMRCVRSEE
jgi:CheY-like chemotaxis protein